MLELKEITKVYPAGGENISALKGIDLRFRRSEFVSILGPSGCGKTTMLNIIGGLDHYTEGDLIINGISTKLYRDRDWDSYRNYSIGFVFQSYNLIPHQSVLRNVELALTLSGVSKSECRRRAVAALEKVGLGDQLKKKPNEMSGGQCQRVAIARAIVNDPDIILADEPTGALDTETSVQVMDILKSIASDRLVIMVTHNPELAEKYSTRIVRMLDGRITSDSMPLSEEEIKKEQSADEERAAEEKEKSKKKPSMSFATSFGLSLKNLFTKKGRTALTSFAGSIGIIGIALIYAVSHGTTTYIDTVQEQTLSSYPLTIEAAHVDTGSLLSTFMGKTDSQYAHEKDAVYQKAMLYEMMNAISSMEVDNNDLRSFRRYIEDERSKKGSKLNKALSGVQYGYDAQLTVYTKNVDGKIIISDTEKLMTELMSEFMGTDFSAMVEMRDKMSVGSMSSLMSASSRLWKEIVPGENGEQINQVFKKQYELLYGSWPKSYDEIILFVDEENELHDITLYALGLKPEKEVHELMDFAVTKKPVEYTAKSWSYQELCGMDFRTVISSECFTPDEATGTYKDLRETEAGLQYLYDNGLHLKVVGIARPDKDAVGVGEYGHIGYTHALTEYILAQSENSDAVKAQKDDPDRDILTGLPFRSNGEKEDKSAVAEQFRKYLKSLDQSGKAEAYIKIHSIPSEAEVEKYVKQATASLKREDIEKMLSQTMGTQVNMDAEKISQYISGMDDAQLREMFGKMASEQFRMQYGQTVKQKLSAMTPAQLAAELDKESGSYSDERCAELYDSILSFSESSYEDNLTKLGWSDPEQPSTINLYAASFADKDAIVQAIDEYNNKVDDLQEIQYTDYVGIMMSSITTIINAIAYVLIAFVAVSLIVSSIMIGVITLISVQERTKEIGILRAIGASKKNVSSMFNAETLIIGFTSGLMGVLITYLLCIPINIIVHDLTGLHNLNAFLPVEAAAVFVGISMLLTLIAGIIPSKSAAKKDPVVALRTE